jgi:hypothetical protein
MPVAVAMEYRLPLVASLRDVMCDADGHRAWHACHSAKKWREPGIPLKQFSESVACPRFRESCAASACCSKMSWAAAS